MSLRKVVYTDKQTPIMAKNLNEIQDAIIELQNKKDELQEQLEALQAKLDNLLIVE